MSLSAKEQVLHILDELPDDSSFDELLRELAMARMIERGLADRDSGRTLSNAEMKQQIDAWAK
jgi:predicted transcriptional regulator